MRTPDQSPILSIGLPVYNGESFLSTTLDSLLAQTFRDFELVICDNASSDRTAEICRAYAARDLRIRYYRNEKNLGAVANYNRVFELSRGPLFKWAAADDIHCDRYLETCLRLLHEDPKAVLAHTDVDFIDDLGVRFPFDASKGSFVDPLTGRSRTPDSRLIGDSPLAAHRFWQVLSGGLWNTHMFGVVRSQALARTKLIANFAGGDRVPILELALLGRFRTAPERLFQKRFHEDVSWALNQTELKGFLSTDGVAYSRRARQVKAYFSAALDKPVGVLSKSICTGMVAVHCVKILTQGMARKEARNAAQGLVWRARHGDGSADAGEARPQGRLKHVPSKL